MEYCLEFHPHLVMGMVEISQREKKPLTVNHTKKVRSDNLGFANHGFLIGKQKKHVIHLQAHPGLKIVDSNYPLYIYMI